MSNKYIEKFFFLTEQNILSSEAERMADKAYMQESSTTSRFKNYRYILAVFAGLVIYMFAHKKPNTFEVSDNILPKFTKSKVVAAEQIPLISIIPSFRLAAQQKYLTETPIKRMDLALLSSSEMEREYQQQVHVMDKVLVVPKLFG